LIGATSLSLAQTVRTACAPAHSLSRLLLRIKPKSVVFYCQICWNAKFL